MVGSGFLTHFQCILKPPRGNNRELKGEKGRTRVRVGIKGDFGGDLRD